MLTKYNIQKSYIANVNELPFWLQHVQKHRERL